MTPLAESEGLLAAVGNTPLVSLDRVFPQSAFRLLAKLEMLNPGGSIKDRPALNMIKMAWASGDIDEKTTIIESSSGNLGVGLSQVCAVLGLRFICVVDPMTTKQNLKMMEVYGAEVDLVTEPDPTTNDFLSARVARVKQLLDTIPGSFWCNQYGNFANAGAHHQTIAEILSACDGSVDYLFCATSSCGTLRGASDYLRQHGLPTKIVAVDAVGSIIFGGPRQKRLIPGHGAARVPELYQPGLEDSHVSITDAECVIGCRRLLGREGILAGGSSGAVISAIEKWQPNLPAGATCAAILCDRGERYLDTIYSDAWVERHLGDVLAHFDKESFP